MTETGYDPAAAITEKLKDMTPDEAVKMVRELCAQLGGDAEGLHGNIWPDNVRLDWEGKAVLGETSEEPANRREAEQVEYLAPEFFWDNEGSAASDVYSLGLLLYAACSGGYLPFQPRGGLLTPKDRSGALRKRMKGEPILPPSGVTPELAAVIKKALAYEPEDRYISAAELLRALGETDEALPVPAAEEPSVTDGPEETEGLADAAEEPAEAEAPAGSGDESEAGPREEPAEEGAPEREETDEPAAEEEPEPEKTLDDVLAEDLSYLDLPDEEIEAAAPETAEPEPETPKYTVRKDFEKSAPERASIPTANRKKRTSPLIPILCVVAVAVIAAALILLRGGKNTESAETAMENTAITYTIEPAATQPPEPVQVTPSLGDDEEADETEPAEEEEFEPTEGAPVGSAVIDGLAVEPAGDIVQIDDTGANLRIGPGTNYRVAESLPRGTELTRTGTVNGWSQVQYNGGEYYIASNLVSPIAYGDEPQMTSAVASEPTEAVGTLVVTADVNIRSGPGTEYDKVGEAKVGAVLTATGRSDDGKWYLVSADGGEGYVNRNLISVRDFASVTEADGTLTVVGEVNLRTGPGTGYDILTVAKAGDELTLTGVTDTGWYRVDHGGKAAYLASNFAAVNS